MLSTLIESDQPPRLASVNLSGTIHREEGRRELQARFGGLVHF
jgi:hypothetical protein